jgi:hypothetical protein
LERLAEDLRDFSAVAADVPGGVIKLAGLVSPALRAMRANSGDATEAVLAKSVADAAEDPKQAAWLAHPTEENRKALVAALHVEASAAMRALAALEAM